ncbi:GTP 3',8-cyclase MoaA [Undibacterium fentianense]|uniref:GTP 3',8-cyclase n=1 Tax=Undibacterium fentianense TaxID=2828728 RepID=A0A941E1M1_9BURK|nr:GTP 3',8-cyclase MoaA [Undibacterium fentianense]MBR7798989.1 GTP 3',8-cyclase MoaA [Undibacterium fentianense]
MTDKFIPIKSTFQPVKLPEIVLNQSESREQARGYLVDRMQRPLQDLRISVTDRCNFRCTYCMPKEIFNKDYPYLPQSDLLSFEEIVRLAKIFVAHGVSKIRLTGGEPLLRKNLEDLIAMLSTIRTSRGDKLDLSLTTNGALLAKKAGILREAGLSRITVSLDALSDPVFKKMNDVDFAVSDVIEGIQAAEQAGFSSLKINMVVKKTSNLQEVVPMAAYFKNSPHILRFIEYMDVGSSNGWRLDEVVPTHDIIQLLASAGMRLTSLPARKASETAERFQHKDGSGEVGFISSVSRAFCSECSRARLSTQGMLYTCLFANAGYDLRHHLRTRDNLASIEENDLKISNLVGQIWHQRADRYSELRSQIDTTSQPENPKIEMSYIGG